MKEYFKSIFKKHMTSLIIYSICYFAGAGIFFQITQQTPIACTVFIAIAVITIIIAIESYFCAKRKYSTERTAERRYDTENLYHRLTQLNEFLSKHEYYPMEHIEWEVERYRKLCTDYKEKWGNNKDCLVVVESNLARLKDLLDYYNLDV